MKSKTRWLVLNLVTLILTAAASDSQAQTVAYRAHGTGRYSPLPTGEYDGRGVGGPLGRHNLFGDVVTLSTADPLVYYFYVPLQQTIGANGDTLLFSGTGRVTLIPIDATWTTFTAVWEGDFIVEGGTGRFARAKPANEPLHIVAVNDPFALSDPERPFSWTLTGRIVLR